MDEKLYTDGVISEPGIYKGVPIERYHHDTDLFDLWSISASGLKKLVERPSLYWADSPYNEHQFPKETTKALVFGRAAHMLLLGDGVFSERYVVQPLTYGEAKKKWNNNATECKAWHQEQAEAGKEVITATDLERLKWMADALHRNPLVQTGVLNGRIERTMVAQFGSIALRARPDVVPNDDAGFADLKTAARVDYESLQRAVFQTGIHIQAAVVRMVSQAIMPEGWEFGGFLLVFVEKDPPFDVVPLELKTVDIDLGEKQVRSALKTLERCISENQWPGADGWEHNVRMLEMPGWSRTRIETDLTHGVFA